MPQDDFHAVAPGEMRGELFGQIDGAVLAAGAAERHGEIFEAARLVVADRWNRPARRRWRKTDARFPAVPGYSITGASLPVSA